ncbi:MAG: aspartate 1-decarboxylase [Candidatus Omnitrophota bacterium]|nr:MAG: aspartate 1-decarboxylase [Candidatus Omnitrophota bacterium]
MMRIMLKSKVYYATINDLRLYYRGSITVDEEIMQKADLREGERVEVLNLNNGARLNTYVIKGKRKSGLICLNGPAARLGYRGDKIIILSYGFYSPKEVKNLKAKFVELNEANRITKAYAA